MGRVRFQASGRTLAVVVGLVLMATPLVQGVALAAAGGRTLDADPEQDDRAVGDQRTVKGILSTAPDLEPINIDFEVAGVGDPGGDGADYHSPDLSCTVAVGVPDNPATRLTDESRTCLVKYRSQVIGHDDVRAWIDEDGDNATIEADLTEQLAGDGTPDGTDVVVSDWFVRPAKGATLDCSPEPLAAVVGGDVVGCRLSGPTGSLAGWLLDGENLGGANQTAHTGSLPADYNDACTTDARGRCEFVLPSTETGSANLCFWIDWDRDLGVHKESDADGSQCDEPVTDAAGVPNITDVVAAMWKQERTLAWASIKTPTYGKRFTLRGKLSSAEASCRSGAAVTIRRTLLTGAQSKVGTKTTTADGSFALTLRAARSARYTATTAANAHCHMATSRAKLVMVHKKVGLSVDRTRVRRGDKVTLRARLAPCAAVAHDKVQLFRSLNGGASFTRIATAATNNNCVATFRVKVWQRSLFKALSPRQDDAFLGGTSSTLGVQLS